MQPSWCVCEHRIQGDDDITTSMIVSTDLEAFPVDNGWSRLVILLLADPHLLEGGQRSQNGASDPDGVFALWWSNDLDLHGGWGERGNFLLHSVSDAWVHG